MPANSAALRLIREPVFVHPDGRSDAIENKDALLLAYLAIEGPTSRRTLAALLWPDVDVERARANLRQRLFRLRKALGRELLEAGEVTALCADIDVDLHGPGAAAGELLHGLVDGVAGGLGDWLDRARERRRAGRASALAEAASEFERTGQLAAALAAAAQLVDSDTTSEHAHRRLMRLHYLRGDRAAALAAFDRCCDVLQNVLGVAPDAETELLRARIEAGALQIEAAPARPLPVSVLRPPRRVGRDAAWQALGDAWAAATPSLIAGEAGLGKTRLVGDFARLHPDCLLVDARPGDARVPHALLSRLLRQAIGRLAEAPLPGVVDELAHLLPELGRAEPMRSSADRMRFVNAVEALLRQAMGEGLAGLVVDDLQFADAASVEVLQHLTAADLGLRLIVAFRPDELAGAAKDFQDELLAIPTARLHRLRPLAAPEVVELLDSLQLPGIDVARVAPAIARHTGGNPLYLLETLKLMLAPSAAADRAVAVVGSGPAAAVPLPTAPNVARLIEQRIGRLSAPAVKLARCAAVAGIDFSAELAADVLGVRTLDLTEAWAELESAQILRDGAFAHDLILEAARDSVPAAIARRLHAEIAGHLEGRQAEPAHVAEHWIEAGDELRALPWLIAAAERAGAGWRLAEEGAWLHRAARIAHRRGSDRDAAFGLLRRAHRACLQANLGSAAHEEILEALAALGATPLERAYAHFARADTRAQRGEGLAAEADARAGLAAIEGESGALADEMHLDLVSALANALFILDRPLEGADAIHAAEPRLLALNDRRREIEHYANLGVLLDAANLHVEAQPAMRHVIALARAEGDRTSELMVLSNLASSHYDVGRPEAARATLREAYRLKESYPELRTSALFLEIQLGNVHRQLGDYAEALDWVERSVPVLSEYVPAFVATAHNGYTRLWLDLGQSARAGSHLRQALDWSAVPPWCRATSHLLRARSALDRGQRGVAAEALAAARDFILPSTRFAVRAQATLLAGRLDDPDAAYRSAAAVAHEAARLQVHGVRIDALTCAARAALACGRPSVAATHAVEAVGAWPESAPDGLYIGEVWLAAVECLEATADARAAPVLREATEWIRATARDRVPDAFRDSFLHRNPFNRDLLVRRGPRP